MKKTDISKLNLNNIIDLMYEPDKNRYSVLEYNSVRKEINKGDFHLALILYENYNNKNE